VRKSLHDTFILAIKIDSNDIYIIIILYDMIFIYLYH